LFIVHEMAIIASNLSFSTKLFPDLFVSSDQQFLFFLIIDRLLSSIEYHIVINIKLIQSWLIIL